MKLNFFILFLSCAISIYYVSAETCAGCATETDPTDKLLKGKLMKMVSKKHSMLNEEPLKDFVVTKSSKQVVAGLKYKTEFNAVGVTSGKKYNCHCSWLEQPWISSEPQILEYKCSSKKKRSV